MRNLSVLLLPAAAALAILSAAPTSSIAANNAPRDEGQQGVREGRSPACHHAILGARFFNARTPAASIEGNVSPFGASDPE